MEFMLIFGAGLSGRDSSFVLMTSLFHVVHVVVLFIVFFFFFQAEDGIRDLTVTGVQTCALPIWMTDPTVVALGTQLLAFLSVSGLFVTVALTYTGGLQGTGDTRSPLYISILSQIVVPLGLCMLFQATRGLHPADIWLAVLFRHMTRCALSVLRFRQGKWRSIRVQLATAAPRS